ncbi:MAG: LemA family protein [Clostridium sp.]|jgi:LemA protein|nr:LemA family protein [Clostridium sp.]
MPIEMIIIVVVLIVFAIVVWTIGTSNRFKKMAIKIDEADSGIDVALNKRYDTLTKLQNVVRSYAKHEKDVLSSVTQMRTGMGIAEKQQINRQLDEAMRSMNVMVENYPELRSNENYLQLQDSIREVEDHLQAARRVYNMNISTFNQSIAVFPASIIANHQHLKPREFFEVDEGKREDVVIDL